MRPTAQQRERAARELSIIAGAMFIRCHAGPPPLDYFNELVKRAAHVGAKYARARAIRRTAREQEGT